MTGLLLLPVALAVGSLWGDRLAGDERGAFRWLLFGLAGWLQLVTLGALGVRFGWPMAAMLLFGFVWALVALGLRRLRPTQPEPPARPTGGSVRWGAAVAVLPLATFAVLAWQGSIAGPDFVIETATPARQMAAGLLPDDAPSLVLHGLALPMRLGASWHVGATLTWSTVCFLGLLIAGRRVLRATPGAAATGPTTELTTVLLACGVAVAGIDGRLAGLDGWWASLALLMACPALLPPVEGRADRSVARGVARDRQRGLAAAIACAVGGLALALAVLLIVVSLPGAWRRGRTSVWALILPPAWTLGCWWLVTPPGASGPTTFEPPLLARLPEVLVTAVSHPAVAAWHGLAIVLVAVPLLVAHPRFRIVGVVVVGWLTVGVIGALVRPWGAADAVGAVLPVLLLTVLPALVTVCGRWMAEAFAGRAAVPTSVPAAPVYDSTRAPHPFDDEWRALLGAWPLVRLWTVRKIRLRYKRSALGVLWTLLEPLALIAILAVVFSTVFRFDVPNYAVYILTGWLAWDFFHKAALGIIGEVSDGLSLTARVHAPRSAFVLAALGAQLFNWCVALVPMAAVLAVLRHPLTAAAWTLPAGMALLALFALGIGLIAATINVFFRDFAPLFQVLLTMWLYATPIIYPLDIVPERARALFLLNPLAHLVTLVRQPIHAGTWPPATVWWTSALLALGTFALGWWAFTRHRDAFAFHA